MVLHGYKTNVRKRGKGLLKEMIRFDVGKYFISMSVGQIVQIILDTCGFTFYVKGFIHGSPYWNVKLLFFIFSCDLYYYCDY